MVSRAKWIPELDKQWSCGKKAEALRGGGARLVLKSFWLLAAGPHRGPVHFIMTTGLWEQTGTDVT